MASRSAVIPFDALIVESNSHPMPLRVAINATPLLAPLTGIGNYIVNLGAALATDETLQLYSLYGPRWRSEAPRPPAASPLGPAVQSLKEAVKPFVPFRRELRALQQKWVFASGTRRYDVDVYHEPNYVPLRCEVPVVVTVHDLSWRHYPDTHPADRVRWLEGGLPRALERAAAILVDSDFIRSELLTAFPVDSARVHTAHLGVSSSFRPREAADTGLFLDALGLMHGRYILTVGTIEPRKNLSHVLAAYARLPTRLRERYPLVVAGAKGWRATDMEAELRNLANRGQIRFLGHVVAEQLPLLLAGAAAFVFPSLYEGFGLPPLEAMASGVPVLVSDRASLPEVVGDAGVTLDPDTPEATALEIEALLDDPPRRQALSQRGVDRARRFTWEACARITANVYRAAAR